jgi:protein SCO1/2
MNSKYTLVGLGAAIGLVIVFGAWWFAQRNYRFQGSLIDPPVPAADITLADQNGNVFQLSEQKGKIVLIFFGYTHCPDVCPVTLSQFKQIKQQLKQGAENIEFVFISVDPERDTPEVIGRYVTNFDASFLGLSGSPAELASVMKSYGVFAQKTNDDGQGNYLVDHTARTYLVDQQGNWRLTYPFGMETEQIIADVSYLLR